MAPLYRQLSIQRRVRIRHEDVVGGEGEAALQREVDRRFDRLAQTGTAGAYFDWSVGDPVVQQVADGAPILRPVFGPGDALLFDNMFLHRTAADPTMTQTRYAIESWFFAASHFPGNHVPIVL